MLNKVPHPLISYLLSRISNQSPSDLGSVIHKLTAKAMIEDYVNGVMDEDQRLHEGQSRKRKAEIIAVSLENAVISPFTSFVAIEQREKDEKVTKTPDVTEIMKDVTWDSLPRMAFSDVGMERRREVRSYTRS